MSGLIVMEGWIKQKNKNKEFDEVYLVLSKTHLKIFRSQIYYKQHPEDALKTLNLTESYNILPMSFNNELAFSVFKKEERALDRLYLNASSKADYESWISQIESVISNKNSKDKESNSKVSTSPDSKSKSDSVAKMSTLRPISQTKNSTMYYPASNRSDSKDRQDSNIKTETESVSPPSHLDNLTKENEKLKSECSNLEMELKKLKEQNEKTATDAESHLKTISQTEARLKKANDENQRLKNEKQLINDKKIGLEKEVEKLRKINGIEAEQWNKIVKELNIQITTEHIDLSSYMFCIDKLIDQNKQSPVLESLLKSQMTNLIHKCPIDLNTSVNILEFLSVNIDLSHNSIVDFIKRLLVSLSNSVNKSATPKSDLDENVVSLIKNIVSSTKPYQKTDPNLNFHQTLLEIAYLLTKRGSFRNQMVNGTVEAVNGIDNQFSNFLKSNKLEETNKIAIIELGQQIKDKYQSKIADNENSKVKENGNKMDSHLSAVINKKWGEMLKKLEQKDLEINDLNIAIRELSSRIIELECDNYNKNSMSTLDEMMNIYSMSSDHLCKDCQSRITSLLEIPVIDKINKLVQEFQSYWESIVHVHSLLSAKQQYNTGLKDMFEKMSQSVTEFESLMTQFSDITQRSIKRPLSSKTSLISNDH